MSTSLPPSVKPPSPRMSLSYSDQVRTPGGVSRGGVSKTNIHQQAASNGEEVSNWTKALQQGVQSLQERVTILTNDNANVNASLAALVNTQATHFDAAHQLSM